MKMLLFLSMHVENKQKQLAHVVSCLFDSSLRLLHYRVGERGTRKAIDMW